MEMTDADLVEIGVTIHEERWLVFELRVTVSSFHTLSRLSDRRESLGKGETAMIAKYGSVTWLFLCGASIPATDYYTF